MLQFGRKHETELKPTDPTKSLHDIRDLMNRQALVRNIELTLDAKHDLPSVMIDSVELEQVIVNLINNSFDALPEGGKVEIIARTVGKEILIEVKDNGSGIPKQDLERIFEPFFTTKPVGQGTGLGLSVCYGLVKFWGGKLEVESNPGDGTTMRIHLPALDKKSNTGGLHEGSGN